MENLYKSLYDDVNLNEDNINTHNFELSVIEKISGHCDTNTLSRYFNIEEYASTVKSLGDNYISIIHVNIRSLHKNFDSLKSFLCALPNLPDVIALTETWLQEHTKHIYSIEGYTPFHLVRTDREHGGITVYTKNVINAEVLEQFCFINRNIEIFSSKLKVGDTTFIISVIYRPQSKHIAVDEFIHIINELFSKETFKCNKTIILGDLNINLLEHATHLPTGLFINAMQTLNYFPHISRPTRFPDSPNLGQPSLLDHIWTNFTPPPPYQVFSNTLCQIISLYS